MDHIASSVNPHANRRLGCDEVPQGLDTVTICKRSGNDELHWCPVVKIGDDPQIHYRLLKRCAPLNGSFELNVAFRFGGTPYKVAERGLKLFGQTQEISIDPLVVRSEKGTGSSHIAWIIGEVETRKIIRLLPDNRVPPNPPRPTLQELRVGKQIRHRVNNVGVNPGLLKGADGLLCCPGAAPPVDTLG